MTALTVANQLTLLRMLLIPAFVILVLYGQLGWALTTFLIAGITDALDGLIARRDRPEDHARCVARPDGRQAAAAERVRRADAAGYADSPIRIPLWLTVLVISRDVAIVLTVAIVNLAIGRRTFRPSFLGKAATAIYIVTCLVFLVANYLVARSLGDHRLLRATPRWRIDAFSSGRCHYIRARRPDRSNAAAALTAESSFVK